MSRAARRRGERAPRARVAATAAIAAIAALAFSHETPARADEKAVCKASSENGQRHRNAGKLTDARTQFALCARAECPSLIRADCTQWRAEVEEAAASVMVLAKDKSGNDVADVQVLVDGKVVTTVLDGKPILVDPGAHVLRFEHAPAPAVEERLTLKFGEKKRPIQVTFQNDAPKPLAASAEGEAEGRTFTPLIVGLGIVGVVGGAGTLFFLLSANGEVEDARRECAPNCSQERVDDLASKVDTKYALAGISGGVGAVALGAAAILYFTQSTPRSRVSRFDVHVRPLPNGSLTELRWSF